MNVAAVQGGLGPQSTFVSRSFILPELGLLSARGKGELPTTGNERPGDRALGPQVRLFGTVASAISTGQSIQRLLSFADLVAVQPVGSTRGAEAVLFGLSRFEGALELLQQEVKALLNSDSVKDIRIESSTPKVQARPTGFAQQGSLNFRVLQPARGQRIASDSQSDIFAPLGLQGSLILEGIEVSVTPTDSLFDIASSIRVAFPEETPVISVTIDLSGRLLLERTPAGSVPIQIQQTGSVATTLGFLASDGNPKNELTRPQAAILETDGQQRLFDTNKISDLFPEIEIELNPDLFELSTNSFNESIEQPIAVTLTVTPNTSLSRDRILQFVETFNTSIRALNELLIFPGTLDGDRSLNASRERILRSVDEPVEAPDLNEGEPTEIEQIGLSQIRAPVSTVSELTLRRLAQFDSSGIPPSPLAFAKGAPSLLQSLGSLGIQRTDDGTLKVDAVQLEKALQEKPEQTFLIFSKTNDSVLPRLQRELDATLDSETGIIARRKRLVQRFQDQTTEGTSVSISTQQLQSVQRETSLQLEQIEVFINTL